MAPRPVFWGTWSGAPVSLWPDRLGPCLCGPPLGPSAEILPAKGRDRTRSDLSLLLKLVACLDRRRYSLLVGHVGPQIADVLDGPDSIEARINRRELAANFFHDGSYIDLVAI